MKKNMKSKISCQTPFLKAQLRLRQTKLSLNTQKSIRPAQNKNKRIRQEYFSVYGEYANRYKIEPVSANFLTKTIKKLDPKFTRYD